MKKIVFLISTLVLALPFSLEATVLKTSSWQTSRGARVIFYQAMEVPMLDISIAFAAGSAFDKQAFGLAALTTRLLNQGSRHLDASHIAEGLADTGARFDSQTSRDMSLFQLKTLTETEALKPAMAIFSQIINQPAFRQDAFNQQKNLQLATITQAQESPEEVADLLFFERLYGQHPYAHPINGDAASLKKLSLWQVKDFYKRFYVAKNAILVMVGAIDIEQAHALAEQLTQGLAEGQAAASLPRVTPLSREEKIIHNFSSSQTVSRLGQTGITHSDPDYFALLVGNYILGGGSLVSRLSQEVREKQGLTYDISSQFIPMPGDGPYIIGFSTRNSQAGKALQLSREVLANFLTTGPTEEELSAAKRYLTGSFPLSLASNSSIAGMLLRMAFYKLPENYLTTWTARIEAVKLEDIKSAFHKQLHPERMLLVSVGKQS